VSDHVLIVDDEPDMVDSLVRILRRAGYHCSSTTDPQRAMALLESGRPDVLLTDLRMSGVDGLDLLRRAKEVDATMPVIVITAHSSIESAVAAIRQGAFDYLPKTFSVDELLVSVERALHHRHLQVENRNLRMQLTTTLGLDNILGAVRRWRRCSSS
jgi:DNA-binding NtrC family response regulator